MFTNNLTHLKAILDKDTTPETSGEETKNVDIPDVATTPQTVPGKIDPGLESLEDATKNSHAIAEPKRKVSSKMRVVVNEDGSSTIDVYMYGDCGQYEPSKFMEKLLLILTTAGEKDLINIHMSWEVVFLNKFETATYMSAIKNTKAKTVAHVSEMRDIYVICLALSCSQLNISDAVCCTLSSEKQFSSGTRVDAKVMEEVNDKYLSMAYSLLLTSGFLTQEEIDSLVNDNTNMIKFGSECRDLLIEAHKTLKDPAVDKQVYTIS